MGWFTRIQLYFEWQSTVHGLGHLSGQTSHFNKIFWSIIIVIAMMGFVTQVTFSVIKYLNFEKTTIVKFNSDETIEFPAVTICNMNPFQQSAIMESTELTNMISAYNYIAQKIVLERTRTTLMAKTATSNTGKPQTLTTTHNSDVSSHATAISVTTTSNTRKPQTLTTTHNSDVTSHATTINVTTSFVSTTTANDITENGTTTDITTPGNATANVTTHATTINVTTPVVSTNTTTTTVTTTATTTTTAATSSTTTEKDATLSSPYFNISTLTPKQIQMLEELAFHYQFQSAKFIITAQSKLEIKIVEIIANMSFLSLSHLTKSRETIRSCSFNQKPCNYEKDFETVRSPHFGICQTFNGLSTYKYNTTRVGSNYGFRVLLYSNSSEYLFSTTKVGARVVVHSRHQYPFPNTEGFNVGVGTNTILPIRFIQTKRLSKPYGNCENGQKIQQNYIFGKTYTLEGCFRSCFQNVVIQRCNCSDPRFPKPPDQESLTFCTSFPPNDTTSCLEELIDEIGDYEFVTGCACRQPCNVDLFISSPSKAKWPDNDAFWGSLCNGKNLRNNRCDEYYRENALMLEVYYATMLTEIIEEVPMMNTMDLFYGIANAIALWLGPSLVVMIVEILLFTLQCFASIFYNPIPDVPYLSSNQRIWPTDKFTSVSPYQISGEPASFTSLDSELQAQHRSETESSLDNQSAVVNVDEQNDSLKNGTIELAHGCIVRKYSECVLPPNVTYSQETRRPLSNGKQEIKETVVHNSEVHQENGVEIDQLFTSEMTEYNKPPSTEPDGKPTTFVTQSQPITYRHIEDNEEGSIFVKYATSPSRESIETNIVNHATSPSRSSTTLPSRSCTWGPNFMNQAASPLRSIGMSPSRNPTWEQNFVKHPDAASPVGSLATSYSRSSTSSAKIIKQSTLSLDNSLFGPKFLNHATPFSRISMSKLKQPKLKKKTSKPTNTFNKSGRAKTSAEELPESLRKIQTGNGTKIKKERVVCPKSKKPRPKWRVWKPPKLFDPKEKFIDDDI